MHIKPDIIAVDMSFLLLQYHAQPRVYEVVRVRGGERLRHPAHGVPRVIACAELRGQAGPVPLLAQLHLGARLAVEQAGELAEGHVPALFAMKSTVPHAGPKAGEEQNSFSLPSIGQRSSRPSPDRRPSTHLSTIPMSSGDKPESSP